MNSSHPTPSTSATAGILASLSDAEQQAAMERFRARVAGGTLSPAIAGVSRIKRLDTTGDTEVLFPRVDLARLDELEPDERVAVAMAEQIVAEAQRHRANVVATYPGSATPSRLVDFDVAAAPEEIVILNPIVGG